MKPTLTYTFEWVESMFGKNTNHTEEFSSKTKAEEKRQIMLMRGIKPTVIKQKYSRKKRRR